MDTVHGHGALRRRWLSGSRRAWQGSFSANAKTAPGELAKDTPIFNYGVVGYRSGTMAHRLRGAGYTQVQNRQGSIFQWANEHRPLVHGDERVTKVHPYTDGWGGARAGRSGVAAEIVSEYPRVLPLMLLLVIVLVLDPLRLRLQA